MASIATSRKMYYHVDPQIFQNFPDARIGVGLAKITVQKKASTKQGQDYLSDYKQNIIQSFKNRGITPDNYKNQNVCQSWRQVFSTYKLNDGKVSTIENLYRRVATEAEKVLKGAKKGDLGRVSNVVDLCNCISLQTDTPMGVLDTNRIQGGLTLRYGKEDETFTPIGEQQAQPITPSQVVLTDHQSILAWLWTYKIGDRPCVREAEDPQYVLVCSDQAEKNVGDARAAVEQFCENLPKIQGQGEFLGVVDKEHPSLEFEVPILDRADV